MATESLELRVSVTGADQGARALDRLKASGESSLRVLAFLRNVLVVAAFARLSSGIYEIVDSFQRWNNQLLYVTGSLQSTGAAMQLVYQIAQQSRQPIEAVVTLFQRMVRTGGTMNLTYGQVATVTKAVAQSFAIAGASADETRNAIIQLTQGLNLGILRGQDLRSVVEFNPVLAQIFADKLSDLGLAVDKYGHKIRLAGGQLYSFVTAHKNVLTAKIAIDAITEAAGKMDEEFQKAPLTLGQVLTTARNTFTYVIGQLLNTSGLLQGFVGFLKNVVSNMGAIIGVAGAVGAAFGTWLVLDLVTLQLAKAVRLGGLLGFILSPVINIAKAFIGLYQGIEAVVYAMARFAVGIGNAAYRVLDFVATTAKLVAGGVVAWFRLVDNLLNAVAIGLRGAITVVVQFGTAFTGALSQVPALFASIVSNLGQLGATAVRAAGQFAITLASGIASAVTSALAAMPAIFLSLLAIIPALIGAVGLLSIAMGGLVSLGSGISGIGDAVAGVADQFSSWHDIGNSLIKLLLVGFDVLGNHLPLVFRVIGEQWNNLVATFLAGIVKIYTFLDRNVVAPLLHVLKILSVLMPILGALAGAGLGAVIGGPVGALIGGFAGVAAGTYGGFKFLDMIDSVTTGWEKVGQEAQNAAAEAAAKSGHAYTDQLKQVIADDMEKYGKMDFLKAMNLLGKGVDLKTIEQQTGVALGDLQKVQSLQELLGMKTPQRGQLTDQGKDAADKASQRAQQLGQFIQQVSPYQAALQKTIQFTNLLVKAEKDGLEVDGKRLTIDQFLANAGLTKAEVLRRLARETVGVGNAETDYADKVKLLSEAQAKGIVSTAEYTAELRKARLEMLSKQFDTSSGIERALLSIEDTVTNKQAIAFDTINKALTDTTTISKYQVQIEALTEAVQKGAITNKQYSDSLRDIQIEALATQKDSLSGFERGMLEVQKDLVDQSRLAAQTIHDIFDGLTDTLTDFFQTGKLNIKDFANTIERDLLRMAVRNVITQPLAQAIGGTPGQQGGSGLPGLLGGLFGGGGLFAAAGQLGSSPSNPLWVQSVGLRGSLDTGLPFGLRGSVDGGDNLAGSSLLTGQQFSQNITQAFDQQSGAGGFVGRLGSILDQVFGSLTGGLTGGSGGGLFSSLLGGVSSLFGFADGGSFMVGGSGGTDSQLVAFKASPNERVTVETPSQRGGSTSDGGSSPIHVTMQVNGARDPDTFQRSQGQMASRLANALARARKRNGG